MGGFWSLFRVYMLLWDMTCLSVRVGVGGDRGVFWGVSSAAEGGDIDSLFDSPPLGVSSVKAVTTRSNEVRTSVPTLEQNLMHCRASVVVLFRASPLSPKNERSNCDQDHQQDAPNHGSDNAPSRNPPRWTRALDRCRQAQDRGAHRYSARL
jgi:hypothetical protein